MDEVGWGWWLLMSVGMVGFWILVIYSVVWLIRGGGEFARDKPPAGMESPEDILKRRLARGEVTVDEYERLSEVLARAPTEPGPDPG